MISFQWEGDPITVVLSPLPKPGWLTKILYGSDKSQFFWAGLIFSNFLIDVIKTQILPAEGSELESSFETVS